MKSYFARICACLPGDTPVELYRSHGPIPEAVYQFWTRGMDKAWEIWAEHRTKDRHCLSDRPRIKHHSGSAKHAIHLTHEQKQEAGI